MAPKLKHRKLLLMGRSGAGKSSMRSIIFSNHLARDVRRLGATIDVEHSNIRFLNNLTLNLWDCGGQDRLMETFLETQREEVFRNVAVCVYVFDVESGGFLGDLAAFERVCAALGEFNRVAGTSQAQAKDAQKEKEKDGLSPGCRIWICIHKMDLIKNLGILPGSEGETDAQGHRKTIGEKRFEEKCAEISKRAGVFKESIEFFGTSIWDQSLYRAWTRIIYHLIPNASEIEAMLRRLTKVIGARECTLFERTTCLTIASAIGHGFGDDVAASEEQNPIAARGEMMSSILKSWKQSLSRHISTPASSAHIADFELKTATFFFFIIRLTENINIAVVMPPSEQYLNAAKANIVNVRPKFAELDVSSRRGAGGPNSAFLEGAARDVVSRGGADG